MNQMEMSKYLKAITACIGIIFFLFIVWLLPAIFNKVIPAEYGAAGFWGACIVVWLTSIPVFACFWKFWGICVRIGEDDSFSKENAKALRSMSHCLLADCIFYVIILAGACLGEWYKVYGIILLFGIFMILVICIAMVILCAALSHLVYKASELQEDQDLTI